MSTTLSVYNTRISDDVVAESHSLSEGGKSLPISFEDLTVEPFCDSLDPVYPKWLEMELSGFAGEFRTHYKSSFSIRLDVLERVLQFYLDGEFGPDDQQTIGQMIWRLAHHATDHLDSDASEQTG